MFCRVSCPIYGRRGSCRWRRKIGRWLRRRYGRLEEGLALVEEVLVFAEQVRVVEPVLMLLYCDEVLRAAGEPERAAAVLAQAQTWFKTIADRIEDEAVRQAYVHNVPAHQVLYARLEREGDGD